MDSGRPRRGGCSTNGRIVFQAGGQSSRRVWLRIRRWHVATTVMGFASWLVGLVLLLLADGGVPGLDRRLDDTTLGRRRGRADVFPAWLVLRRTTGWPRDWQVDLARSFAAVWRGPGAMAAGTTWLGHGALVWVPKPTWAQLGARSFELRLDRTERIELTQLSRRSAGLAVRQSDGAEVWLWLRSSDHHRLSDLLRTYTRRLED